MSSNQNHRGLDYPTTWSTLQGRFRAARAVAFFIVVAVALLLGLVLADNANEHVSVVGGSTGLLGSLGRADHNAQAACLPTLISVGPHTFMFPC